MTSNTKNRHFFLVSGNKFDVDTYYVPQKACGSGAYGVVISAIDKNYNDKRAIKKCNKAFEDVIDGKRILREIKILQHFDHENLIKIVDMVPPRDTNNLNSYNDVYMVLEYMESDLHKIIYSKNKLTEEHYQYFVYQILKGLKYMHSSGIIHRDLKPSNLLVNSNCDLKICDFGLARSLEWQYELTEYVVTRWYRAPEIMCAAQEYNTKIDVWSVGCILSEMIKRKPLFPGDHYIQQLNLIFDFVGVPSGDDLKCVTNTKALKYIQKLKPKQSKDFSKVYRNCSKDCIDLLKRMLVFDPNKRISIDDALRHPFLKALHNPENEKLCSDKLDFSFELKCKDRKGLKNQMLQTCLQVRKKYNQTLKMKQNGNPMKNEA